MMLLASRIKGKCRIPNLPDIRGHRWLGQFAIREAFGLDSYIIEKYTSFDYTCVRNNAPVISNDSKLQMEMKNSRLKVVLLDLVKCNKSY